MSFDLTVVPSYLDTLFLGALWTVAITLGSAVLSFFGGIVLAVISLYAPLIIRLPFRLFAWMFMGTPLLLQLFLIYFGLIEIGIDLAPFVSGVIGLGIHFAVYNADIIESGIRAVDKGQYEGARTLGLSKLQTIHKIVVPQAVRSVMPPIGNNMIALLKDSALVSVIGVAELTLAAQLAISKTFHPFEFYLAAAVFYYVINLGMEFGLRRIERRIQLAR